MACSKCNKNKCRCHYNRLTANNPLVCNPRKRCLMLLNGNCVVLGEGGYVLENGVDIAYIPSGTSLDSFLQQYMLFNSGPVGASCVAKGNKSIATNWFDFYYNAINSSYVVVWNPVNQLDIAAGYIFQEYIIYISNVSTSTDYVFASVANPVSCVSVTASPVSSLANINTSSLVIPTSGTGPIMPVPSAGDTYTVYIITHTFNSITNQHGCCSTIKRYLNF